MLGVLRYIKLEISNLQVKIKGENYKILDLLAPVPHRDPQNQTKTYLNPKGINLQNII